MANITVQMEDNRFLNALNAAMKIPGVKINRATFLKKELSVYFSHDIVELAISKNPAMAGISVEDIERIARSCIEHETKNVSLISAAAGIPGGIAMLGSVPADVAQYFAHMIKILQKLVYLYGWEELYNINGEFDDETTDKVILFMGVMFGVNAANAAVGRIAKLAAIRVQNQIAKKALTKGLIYPVVKRIAQILGVKMTKKIFAKGVAKVVPILGGALSGGLTYFTFKPAANNLKNRLKTLQPASVDFYKVKHDDIEEVDFIDIEDLD